MTLVRNVPGVRLVIRRSKVNITWEGRPMSRWSRMTPSKKGRPAAGRSNTRVSETSNWRNAIRPHTRLVAGQSDVAEAIGASATVAILRLSDGLIEHLVLGEAVLVLGLPGGHRPRGRAPSRATGSAS
jgi:hypothetical protein